MSHGAGAPQSGDATKASGREAGFTLIELAVVLVILALILGGILVPLSAQIEQQRIAETQRLLDQAREAVVGFALATGRLPCPATANVANTVAGAGTENRAGTACGIVQGVVPWVTLGVSEVDAWNRRFSYRIRDCFADDPGVVAAGCGTPTFQSSFLLTDDGNITVQTLAAGGTNVATNLPVIIVSHGANGFGAFRPDGAQLGASTSADEAENSDNDAIFVSRTQSPTYDDLVAWVPPNILKTRMVAAGRLP